MSKARGPYRVDPLGYKKANEALDKMAENARELGLDYELQDKDPDLIEQPAQQQEPVAWIVEDQSGERLEWAGDAHSCHGVPTFPLYTSPPAQRTWVELTDEEIESIFNNWPTYHLDHEEFARAIEAKLKQRNT